MATVAVNGARNAGLLAVRILAVGDAGLTAKMEAFQAEIAVRRARPRCRGGARSPAAMD